MLSPQQLYGYDFLLSYTLDAILLRPDLHKFWKGHLFLYAILTYFTPDDNTINVYMYIYLQLCSHAMFLVLVDMGDALLSLTNLFIFLIQPESNAYTEGAEN